MAEKKVKPIKKPIPKPKPIPPSGGKAGGYNQRKKERTDLLDSAFDYSKIGT